MCCDNLKKLLQHKEKCVSQSNVAKENGREFRINSESNSTICKIKVDGCLITGIETNKCDYILKVCDTGVFYLVELKGGDILHAVSQITSTIDQLKDLLRNHNHEGIIISSAVPKAEQRFRQVQEKVRRERNLKITKHSFSKIINV